MRRYKPFLWIPLSLFLLGFGCAHYPLNQPLDPQERQDGYTYERSERRPGADETFIALTFSGGGTRAAALAYGVLDRMRRIKVPGTDRTLLDEVDAISTVSGGSFTGAYYGLFGDRLFTDFRKNFLERNIQCDLALKVANPLNWFRLASPWFSRIDLAAARSIRLNQGEARRNQLRGLATFRARSHWMFRSRKFFRKSVKSLSPNRP